MWCIPRWFFISILPVSNLFITLNNLAAERYLYIEAGHAGQNLLLQATALGLGSVIIGAFLDGLVKNVLGRDESEQPISLLPVGRRTE